MPDIFAAKTVARRYGTDKAVIIQKLAYCIRANREQGIHEHDGRTWVRAPLGWLHADLDWISERTIRRHLDEMISEGLLVEGWFNGARLDHRRWLAFADEESILRECFGFCPERPQPEPDPPPDRSGQSGHNEVANLATTKWPIWPLDLTTKKERQGIQETEDPARARASPPPAASIPSVPLAVVPPPKKAPKKAAKGPKEDPPWWPVWMAYQEAYEARYGVVPIVEVGTPNAFTAMIRAMGLEEACAVARFYLRHSDQWFVKMSHSVRYLANNANKLRTEMLNGRKVTSSVARKDELTANNMEAVALGFARFMKEE